MEGSVLCKEHHDKLPAPMRGEPPSSETVSTGLPVSPEIFAGVIADRIAGLEYPVIASKYGIHHGTARRIARRAIASGLVSAEQVGYKPLNRSYALPKDAYDARWIVRVKSKCVVDGNGCWLWQGFVGYKGYGNTNYRNGSGSVHRRMYQVVHGVTLKTEQFVCHRCDVRRCCNPDHLVLADNDWNMADKTAKGRHHEMRVTHCPLNHPYNSENTYFAPNGSRHCKACKRYQLRLKAGWPEELALHPGRVPAGYTKETLCRP
jgi:hypothetical protein